MKAKQIFIPAMFTMGGWTIKIMSYLMFLCAMVILMCLRVEISSALGTALLVAVGGASFVIVIAIISIIIIITVMMAKRRKYQDTTGKV